MFSFKTLLKRNLLALMFLIIAVLLFAMQAAAGEVKYSMSWEGQNGYTAQGYFTYDDSTSGKTVIGEELTDFYLQAFDPQGNSVGEFRYEDRTLSNSVFFFTFDTIGERILLTGEDDPNDEEEFSLSHKFWGFAMYVSNYWGLASRVGCNDTFPGEYTPELDLYIMQDGGCSDSSQRVDIGPEGSGIKVTKEKKYYMSWQGTNGYAARGYFTYNDTTVGKTVTGEELADFYLQAFDPQGNSVGEFRYEDRASNNIVFYFAFDTIGERILLTGEDDPNDEEAFSLSHKFWGFAVNIYPEANGSSWGLVSRRGCNDTFPGEYTPELDLYSPSSCSSSGQRVDIGPEGSGIKISLDPEPLIITSTDLFVIPLKNGKSVIFGL